MILRMKGLSEEFHVLVGLRRPALLDALQLPAKVRGWSQFSRLVSRSQMFRGNVTLTTAKTLFFIECELFFLCQIEHAIR